MSKEEITIKDTGTTGPLWIALLFFFNKECWGENLDHFTLQ